MVQVLATTVAKKVLRARDGSSVLPLKIIRERAEMLFIR